MVVLIELSSVVDYGELTTFSQVLANTTKNRITGEQLLNGKWNNKILLSKITLRECLQDIHNHKNIDVARVVDMF